MKGLQAAVAQDRSHTIPLRGTPALAPKAFCGDPTCPPWRRAQAEGRGAGAALCQCTVCGAPGAHGSPRRQCG